MHMIQSAEFKGFKKRRPHESGDADEDQYVELSSPDSERKTVFLKSGNEHL